MEKQKITYVSRTQRTSKKDGKPFTSISIKTDRHGDKFLSGFGNEKNERWIVGDEIEIEVVQKGEYWNFNMPKAPTASVPSLDGNKLLQEIAMRLQSIEMLIRNRLPDPQKNMTSAGTKVPDFSEVDYPND